MKLKIFTIQGTEKGSIDLPEQFSESPRKDLVKRAVLAIQARNRTPYGSRPDAGKRASAYVSKRRRDYKGTYGIGQSRTPRKALSRNGTRFNWVGAFAPQTVGGRQAHPPKASKIWTQKINEQENRKAIRSALASVMIADIVKGRGHKIPSAYPFIIADDFNTVKKTAELKKILLNLGFEAELKRSSVLKVRAGKGKARGRKYKTKKGILFVTASESDLFKSARNIPGSEITLIDNVNVELLAPGAQPGRVTLFTESAIKKLTDKKLFAKDFKGEVKKVEKKEQSKDSSKETKSAVKKTAEKKIVSTKPAVKKTKKVEVKA
ncbi:MAG: 50S ribosomal protein L4 [Candidatus Nanoarchaeia archaeon]